MGGTGLTYSFKIVLSSLSVNPVVIASPTLEP